MSILVYCVVEGHGDVKAFPILVRRICNEVFGEFHVQVETPYRLPKNQITKKEALEPVLFLGAARLRELSAEGDKLLIIISRDADDECPVTIAKSIHAIASNTAASSLCAAVIPNEEFEGWLLAGAAPLAGHQDCNAVPYETDDADAVTSPKGVFDAAVLRPDRHYSETVDQPKFTAQMALDAATFGRSRSLRRLRDVIERCILA